MYRPVLGAALAVACALPGASWAHGQHYEGFVSTISEIDPPLPGLLANVLDGDRRLSLENLTQETVVILDRHGRPFVRLRPGQHRSWHEPRIHSAGPPPRRSGLVRRWKIPGRAGGEPFVIEGYLGYAAPAAPPASQGTNAGVIAAVVVITLVLLAALALPLVRRKGEG